MGLRDGIKLEGTRILSLAHANTHEHAHGNISG